MESRDYSELTSYLDAREILRYLNNLGIHNINGEVLKYFITDLKKLIKYDLANKNKHLIHNNIDYIPGPERLHSASTLSSRLKSKNHGSEPVTCNRKCYNNLKFQNVRNIRSAPNIREQKFEDKLPRRSCSCVRVEKKPQTPKDTKDKSTATSSNNNLIKIPKPTVKKKCDPVSLYHYYISQWAKYKPNVPGENDWAELRWNIRQKMVGQSSEVSNKY